MIEGNSLNKICLEISSYETILNFSNEDNLSVKKIIPEQNHRCKKLRTFCDRGFECFKEECDLQTIQLHIHVYSFYN
jgi:hypothetical protein